MVQHYVFWNFNSEMSMDEKVKAGETIKESLEQLPEKMQGIISLTVVFDALESSNRELALLSTFESKEALDQYQIHPDHVKAASYIKSVTCDRICFDYVG